MATTQANCFVGVRVAHAGQHPFLAIIHLFLACGPRASEQCYPWDIPAHTPYTAPLILPLNVALWRLTGATQGAGRGGDEPPPQSRCAWGQGDPSCTAQPLLRATSQDTSRGLTCPCRSGGNTTPGRCFPLFPLAQCKSLPTARARQGSD